MQLWATRDWQLHHNTPAHASSLVQSFLVTHQVTQVTQPLYSPHLAHCYFCLCPKLKSPLKGKRFQTISEIQEHTMGKLVVIGRTVQGPKVPTLRGLRCYYPMHSVSYIFINKCLFFSYCMDGYFLTHLVYSNK